MYSVDIKNLNVKFVKILSVYTMGWINTKKPSQATVPLNMYYALLFLTCLYVRTKVVRDLERGVSILDTAHEFKPKKIYLKLQMSSILIKNCKRKNREKDNSLG